MPKFNYSGNALLYTFTREKAKMRLCKRSSLTLVSAGPSVSELYELPRFIAFPKVFTNRKEKQQCTT
jgi:hypothetical protein